MTSESLGSDVSLSVGEFVAYLNQTLEYAYPNVTITGELANFRISKNRWVYFDLKDDTACVKFFGTIYQLPGPLEDGMMLAVRGLPRLHPLYGFSVTAQAIQPVGEGSIKKAAKLLEAKLAAEGLFDAGRKRFVPYPPKSIGLIASGESAAYRDFMKIIDARWCGVDITLIDVQVQGEPAVAQICAAIEQFNGLAEPPEVLVVTRGGGSADDLAAFSTEQVTRAVAASRIPTVVAIGHEIDTSLAEMAADQRASTPSNAAELLVPDRRAVLENLGECRKNMLYFTERRLGDVRTGLLTKRKNLQDMAGRVVGQASANVEMRKRLLEAFNPQAALDRGYALIRKNGAVLRSGRGVKQGDIVEIELMDARIAAEVKEIHDGKK